MQKLLYISVALSALILSCVENPFLASFKEDDDYRRGITVSACWPESEAVVWPDGTLVITPASESDGASACILLSLNNKHNFEAERYLFDNGPTKNRRVYFDQRSPNLMELYLEGARVGDAFNYTLQMRDLNGPNKTNRYPLPSITCLSFNADLAKFIVQGGTEVFTENGDLTNYRVSVPYSMQNVAITGIPAEIHAELSGGVVRDIPVGETEVTLTLMAQNRVSVKSYRITVVRREDRAKDITSFAFPNGAVTINGTDVSVQVYRGAVLTGVTPTVSHTGASYSPTSAQDFSLTQPTRYTVTADDGTTKHYVVSIVEGGQPIIAIVFDNPFDYGLNEITQSTEPLVGADNTRFTVTICGPAFSRYEWWLDGTVLLANGPSATLTKSARDFGPGSHRITTKLITAAGDVYSSKTVEFTVQ
jgi:hypothetical protein